MSYRGDIRLGDTIDIKFTTRRFSTGAPFTLAGTPAIAAYVGNGTTEITAGITLTTDFDSRTGLNNVRVVASSGNGFATATNIQLVITAGTVDSISVVGEVVGSFSIENRSALMPATAGRTVVVDAAGLADANAVKVGPTGSGTAQTAGDVIGDTNDIQARLPAALTGDGNIKADTLRIGGTLQTAGDFLGIWTTTRAGYVDNLAVLKIKKNTAYNNFAWLMIDSADHFTPKTGLTVTCQRSIDGAAFANCNTVSATEVGSGIYKVNLAASDLNGDSIMLKFTAAGGDTRFVFIAPEP